MSVAAAGTIGAFLIDALDQVDQVVIDARNSGSTLEAEAGRQAAITIANVQGAYSQSLNETIDKLSPVVKNAIDQLTSQLSTTEFKTTSDLQKITDQLQVIVHSLPLRQHQPQLINVTPSSIIPTQSSQKVRITVTGSFEDSSLPGHLPSLRLANVAKDTSEFFTLIANSDKALTFEVPLNLLMQEPDVKRTTLPTETKGTFYGILQQLQAVEDQVSKITSAISAQPEVIAVFGTAACPNDDVQPDVDRMQTSLDHRTIYDGSSTLLLLSVPWSQSKFLGLAHSVVTSRFNLIVDRLPVSPGTLTLLYSTTKKLPAYKLFTSPPYNQASTASHGNNDDKDHPYPITPETGWHVVRNSSSFNVRAQTGVWSRAFAGDDGDQVRYNVSTIHKKLGTSGDVTFTISFLETSTADCVTHKVKPYLLRWGDSVAIDPSIQNWRLTYVGFDGTRTDFAGSDLSNPYVHIVNENGTFIIKATDPSLIHWPPIPQ